LEVENLVIPPYANAFSMENIDAKMEREWGRAFVHESGHALMAVLQEIPCHGIFYEFHDDKGKFCTLADLPTPAEYSKGHYLFLTASTAAELVIYGNQDDDAAKSDRASFGNSGAPPLQETIDEAQTIVSARKRHIKNLVAQLKANMRQADYDVGRLPEITKNDKRYAVLLPKEEVEALVREA
jgi:hypothetical protein